MSSPRAGLRTAAVLFALFAVGHLVRLLTHSRVLVGTHEIPMAISVIALLVASGLALWLWKLSTGD
jgi:uncharacterized membrane protein YcfT